MEIVYTASQVYCVHHKLYVQSYHVGIYTLNHCLAVSLAITSPVRFNAGGIEAAILQCLNWPLIGSKMHYVVVRAVP